MWMLIIQYVVPVMVLLFWQFKLANSVIYFYEAFQGYELQFSLREYRLDF